MTRDITNPDHWPNLSDHIMGLGPTESLLRAEVDVALARGLDTGPLRAMLYAVQNARRDMARVELMSPLAAWAAEHVQRPGPEDGMTDCGSPNCPRVGFKDKEDRDLHYRRWDLTSSKPS